MIRINRAVRAYGVYTIGGMRNKYKQNNVADWTQDPVLGTPRGMAGSFGLGAAPLERYHMSGTSMNAQDGTFGTWEQFRLTATFPWGIWSSVSKTSPLAQERPWRKTLEGTISCGWCRTVRSAS